MSEMLRQMSTRHIFCRQHVLHYLSDVLDDEQEKEVRQVLEREGLQHRREEVEATMKRHVLEIVDKNAKHVRHADAALLDHRGQDGPQRLLHDGEGVVVVVPDRRRAHEGEHRHHVAQHEVRVERGHGAERQQGLVLRARVVGDLQRREKNAGYTSAKYRV